MNIITGSSSIGDFRLEFADQSLINIVDAMDTLNDPNLVANLQGMNFLDTFIKDIEGVQGHIEGEQKYNVFVSDDGSYQDATAYLPQYNQWTFYRKGYIVKAADFSAKMFEEAYETGKDLNVIVSQNLTAVGEMYVNRYLPKVAYETLFTVPTTGGAYTEKFGFLRDVAIDSWMLKPYAQDPANLVRNHWRGIAGATVELDDLQFALDYLNEYNDVMDSSIVGVATRSTLSKLVSVLNIYGSNMDIFERTGQPTTELAGMRYIKNDFMPKDIILFLAGDASHLITRLISPKADLRGIGLYKEEGFTSFQEIKDLKNTFFKIQPVGYHLTGRHFGMFLSIAAYGGNGSANADRVMGSTEVARIQEHAATLRSSWYNGLR